MRIRTIKPEFWKSSTVAQVSWGARLVLKALEAYVDDNGAGRFDLELIVTEMFPRDYFRNPPEVLARVSEAVSELLQAGLVWIYDTEDTSRGGRSVKAVFISNWEQTQRIDKPNRGRIRRPDGTLEYRESEIREYSGNVPEVLASIPEVLAPVTEEQSNRGTGDIPPIVPLAGDGANTNLDDPYPAWEHLPAKGNSKIYPEQFTQWHDAYPHARDQSDLKNQYRAWRQAITRDTIENILDGTRRYANDPNRAPTYTPSAARWLRKNGWQDPALPPRQPSMYTRSQQAAAADFARLTNQNTPLEIERNPQ